MTLSAWLLHVKVYFRASPYRLTGFDFQKIIA